MASLKPMSLSSLCQRPSEIKRCHFLVRAQSYRGQEGKPSIVDANMKSLRERIEHIKVKERVERCCRREQGWDYLHATYDPRAKKASQLSESVMLLNLAATVFGITIFSGTIGLTMFSLLVHVSL
ncbi:hypothetical protein AMTRI_Chr13g119010 [Amborella trichopoda]|uniref:Uncharacterized protein n=1 Tax=Amborella trichopoda TaxID=13333 RepID=W1NZD8_AMBTC|nr:hypothetical protein AMTR_s00105p00131970 [Amborella trichopoda]